MNSDNASIIRRRNDRLGTTAQAGEDHVFHSKVAKGRVRSASRTLQVSAAAVVANVWGSRRVVVLRVQAKLLKFRFHRIVLGLKIRTAAFKYFVLGLDEPQSLTNDRRTAVLVDKFFKNLKHRIRGYLGEGDV